MEKYSVLLVDDEEDVIQIIMKKMDWVGKYGVSDRGLCA